MRWSSVGKRISSSRWIFGKFQNHLIASKLSQTIFKAPFFYWRIKNHESKMLAGGAISLISICSLVIRQICINYIYSKITHLYSRKASGSRKTHTKKNCSLKTVTTVYWFSHLFWMVLNEPEKIRLIIPPSPFSTSIQ